MLSQECAVARHSVGVAVLYPLSGWDANSVVSCPHSIQRFPLKAAPCGKQSVLPVQVVVIQNINAVCCSDDLPK